MSVFACAADVTPCLFLLLQKHTNDYRARPSFVTHGKGGHFHPAPPACTAPILNVAVMGVAADGTEVWTTATEAKADLAAFHGKSLARDEIDALLRPSTGALGTQTPNNPTISPAPKLPLSGKPASIRWTLWPSSTNPKRTVPLPSSSSFNFDSSDDEASVSSSQTSTGKRCRLC